MTPFTSDFINVQSQNMYFHNFHSYHVIYCLWIKKNWRTKKEYLKWILVRESMGRAQPFSANGVLSTTGDLDIEIIVNWSMIPPDIKTRWIWVQNQGSHAAKCCVRVRCQVSLGVSKSTLLPCSKCWIVFRFPDAHTGSYSALPFDDPSANSCAKNCGSSSSSHHLATLPLICVIWSMCKLWSLLFRLVLCKQLPARRHLKRHMPYLAWICLNAKSTISFIVNWGPLPLFQSGKGILSCWFHYRIKQMLLHPQLIGRFLVRSEIWRFWSFESQDGLSPNFAKTLDIPNFDEKSLDQVGSGAASTIHSKPEQSVPLGLRIGHTSHFSPVTCCRCCHQLTTYWLSCTHFDPMHLQQKHIGSICNRLVWRATWLAWKLKRLPGFLHIGDNKHDLLSQNSRLPVLRTQQARSWSVQTPSPQPSAHKTSSSISNCETGNPGILLHAFGVNSSSSSESEARLLVCQFSDSWQNRRGQNTFAAKGLDFISGLHQVLGHLWEA